MTLAEVTEFVLSLTPHDFDNLTALAKLGQTKCEVVLIAAQRTGNARNVQFAEVALFLSIIGATNAEVRKQEDHQEGEAAGG